MKNQILIVDDEKPILNLLKLFLTRGNYDVIECESGSEALKVLKEQKFDCIVTDAIMPIMSGFDLVKAIRKNPAFKQIPILMLTRKRDREDVKKAMEAGVTDYIIKPVDEHLLLDKVDLLIKKSEAVRHIFECRVREENSAAELQFPAKITYISESDLTVRLPFQINSSVPFKFSSPLFKEIGIEMPLLNFIHCTDLRDKPNFQDFQNKEFPFDAKFTFLGVEETDLKKIRTWLQKQDLQYRK
jgi:DNA-binding response OmpR family regulator